MNCFPTNFQCVAEIFNVLRTASHNFRRQAVIFHENFTVLYHLYLAVLGYLGTYAYKGYFVETSTHSIWQGIMDTGAAYRSVLLLLNTAGSVQDGFPYLQRQNDGSERLWYHPCTFLPSPYWLCNPVQLASDDESNVLGTEKSQYSLQHVCNQHILNRSLYSYTGRHGLCWLLQTNTVTTNYMAQSPFWEASRSSASQEMPRILQNQKVQDRNRKSPHEALWNVLLTLYVLTVRSC
jgi:hypothetical protein